jgi:hypothetical protein
MKYNKSTYDFVTQNTIYQTVELSEEQEREQNLEKRTISIIAKPCRGNVHDTLTITSLEGYAPNFEFAGNDLPRLLRRLELVKRDIDLFIAEFRDLMPREPKEPGVLRDVILPVRI